MLNTLQEEHIANKSELGLAWSNVDYTCSICKNILIEPQLCSICGISCCKKCITEWYKEKNSCPKGCLNGIFVDDRVLPKLLEKLKFVCVNSCGTIFEYNKAKEHFENCPNKKLALDRRDKKTKIEDLEKKINEIFEFNKVLEEDIEPISETILKTKESISELKPIVDETEENFNEVKEEHSSFMEEFNEYKIKLDKISHFLNREQHSLKRKLLKRSINTDLVNLYQCSKIIDTRDEMEMINDAIEDKTQKDISKIIKIYQASKDGDDAKIFHKKCDKIKDTLVLIESIEGNRFGGFNPSFWEPNEEQVVDESTFVFSLNDLKIFGYKGRGRTILGDEEQGPIFGRTDIFVGNNFLSTDSSYTKTNSVNASFGGEDYKLGDNPKGNYFVLKDIEVLQIIFE